MYIHTHTYTHIYTGVCVCVYIKHTLDDFLVFLWAAWDIGIFYAFRKKYFEFKNIP